MCGATGFRHSSKNDGLQRVSARIIPKTFDLKSFFSKKIIKSLL
jgi:hypothetical protein